ncbi:hypothetical protein FBU30_010075, partial [Linnemannia zychae]
MVEFGLKDNPSDEEEMEFHMANEGLSEEAQIQQQQIQQQQIQQQQIQQQQLQQLVNDPEQLCLTLVKQNTLLEEQNARWVKQEEQNNQMLAALLALTRQLAENVKQVSSNKNPPTPAGPAQTPPSLSQVADIVPTTIPQVYGRYDDPNRPAPEFPARIPNFTGDDLTLDLDEYLTDIELHFTNKNCPEKKKVTSFLSLLKSGARQWSEKYLEPYQYSGLPDWPTYKAAFRARWRITHLTTNLRAEIESLKQASSEPLSAFAARYLALANRIPDRSDKDKKLDFARKIPYYLQQRISDLHREEDTLDVFLQKVVTKDAAIKTFENRNGSYQGRKNPYSQSSGIQPSPDPSTPVADIRNNAPRSENDMDIDNI